MASQALIALFLVPFIPFIKSTSGNAYFQKSLLICSLRNALICPNFAETPHSKSLYWVSGTAEEEMGRILYRLKEKI